MAAKSFKVKVTDAQGGESSKTAKSGDRISKFVEEGMTVLLNGEASEYDAEVRAGDHIEVQRKSGKAGK